jgi:hypothetical protein
VQYFCVEVLVPRKELFCGLLEFHIGFCVKCCFGEYESNFLPSCIALCPKRQKYPGFTVKYINGANVPNG